MKVDSNLSKSPNLAPRASSMIVVSLMSVSHVIHYDSYEEILSVRAPVPVASNQAMSCFNIADK